MANQLCDFLLTNNLFDVFQSHFQKDHSTESALVKVTKYILITSEEGRLSVFVLFDLPRLRMIIGVVLSNQIKSDLICIARNHNLQIISLGFNRLYSCDIFCP